MYQLILTIVLVLCSNHVWAETYKCVKAGKTSYQQTPCETSRDMQSSTLKTLENTEGVAGLNCKSPDKVISLNFNNRSIRSVLQLFADFSGSELVADRGISGRGDFNYQLRPWCEILADVARQYQLEVRFEGKKLYARPR